MRTPEPLAIVGFDVRKFDRPDPLVLPESRRDALDRRMRCLDAVAGGVPIERAAKLYRISPRTAKDDAQHAMEEGPDGRLMGYRACLPHRRRPGKARPTSPHRVRKTGPHAMTRVIKGDPQIERMLEDYKGDLPNGKRKNRKFDALHGAMLTRIEATLGADAYPFGTPDKGRRQLLRYMRRLRRRRLDAGAPVETRPEANANSLRDLLELRPLERVEFDAHGMDVEAKIEVEKPEGGIALVEIRRLTLLTIICTITRYLLAHLLVLGEYNRLHVLRLFRRALSPWAPREYIVPDLPHVDGARLGLAPDARGGMPRAVIVACDNAMSHHATIARDALHRYQRGLMNYGRSRCPEARGLQEVFFNLVERGAIRGLPGGFEPDADGTRHPTNTLRAEDYPLQWEAMQDTMEVVCAGYNVTPHNGLSGRTPAQVLDEYLASGWVRETSDPARDARALTTIRINPTIRGGRESGRYPFIEYMGATYRSDKLRGARSRVGEKVDADVDVDDLTSMVVLDESGLPWSKLHALPPWDRTPHDLHLRQQINRARSRKLFSIAGADDAVAAYAAYCKSVALSRRKGGDTYARLQYEVLRAPSTPLSVPYPEVAQIVDIPRSGRTSFAAGRD